MQRNRQKAPVHKAQKKSLHTATKKTKKVVKKRATVASRVHNTMKRPVSFKYTEDMDAVVQYTHVDPRRHVQLLGVPFAFGQPLQGVDRAPQDMRHGGLIPRVEEQQWKVVDNGDIAVPVVDGIHEDIRVKPDGTFKMRCADVVSKVCQDTAEKVATALNKNDFMLTIGGDHSIAMGSIAGILKARPNTGIIWVDAHADINTPYTSETGNIHGMPVAFLMKHPHVANIDMFEWLKEYPTLDPRRIVYIGLRDVDVGEKRILRQSGIKAFTMQDVDKFGIGQVMAKAIEHLTNDRRLDIPIHLSLDIDGVDPLFAPATGTRVFGGLSYREAYYICEALAETGLLSSMDLVEVNPSLGETPEASERTIKIANGLIAAALGNRII